MEKSKVYFTDMRALPGTSLPQKLQKLMRRTGIADIDFERKITAIKMHFGEPGNLSYLRPNYAKAVADLVKELGGRPFLTGSHQRMQLFRPSQGKSAPCAGASERRV